ncbi:MAG TPA: bifunctional 5,10-methylenetetrahydrofolate dehydrogenase/5,10-methenyltetrahydrofolate cyclohydrolase [Ktedonobacteraceae bacterium]|nr:bifunctional 5,10-methylenetetrahydrofolate dehydrogenase/5,10-methenyltetrahydrofolate cyclohydrolase [Ktedonobacteraceae bacterium]
MTARIIDGRALGSAMRGELREEIAQYVQEHGSAPGLVVLRVEGDAASGVYSKAILRIANDVGIQARQEVLPTTTSPEELRASLVRLNQDETVHGIIVQMPLPAHLPQQLVIETISAAKDIDGISVRSAGNLFLGLPGLQPSTAVAVMESLKRSEIELAGKQAVIVGRSNVVGKPLALLLLQKHATVTVCHSRSADLSALTRQADILIAAAGRAKMITAEMVKPGATVIDVGTNALPEGGIVGDVDFATVSEVAGAITPVPGGIGPLTNVMLLKQCLQAARAISA